MAETVTLTADDKLGGIGASDIGKLFTKAGIKAKTAQTLAYEKAVIIFLMHIKTLLDLWLIIGA